MKKTVVLGIIAALAVVTLTACGGKKQEADVTPEPQATEEAVATEAPAAVEIASSDEALNKVLDTYAEDEKFPIMGGDFENVVDGKAGIYNLADTEGLMSTLHISEDLIAQIDEAGSAVHAMNANTFTGAAFHLVEGTDAATFAASLKDSVLATQWMCGFPEKLTIYTVNSDYVLYAVGTADIVDNFNSKVQEVYGEAAVVVSDGAVE